MPAAVSRILVMQNVSDLQLNDRLEEKVTLNICYYLSLRNVYMFEHKCTILFAQSFATPEHSLLFFLSDPSFLLFSAFLFDFGLECSTSCVIVHVRDCT